jgi:hypothetical protein
MAIWPFLRFYGIALASLGWATPVFSQTVPDYYVGAGARFGFNDNVSFVVDSKAKLADLGDFTVSARPSVLFGSDVELRLPLSIEAPLNDGVYPYGGAGVAYNADGNSSFDPMLTGGVDLELGNNLVLDVGLNVVFKPGNTDTEMAATLNYRF